MRYKHTHRSTDDGSPAMLVRRLNEDEFLLVNENGDEWTDEAALWAAINEENP